MKKLSSLIFLVLLAVSIIMILPYNFPQKSWVASKTWESVSILRYYAGKCADKNPSFFTYLLTHPVSTLLFYLSSKLFSFLDLWKQFSIITFSSFLIGGFFLFLILGKYIDKVSSFFLTIFFLLQTPLWGWVFSPFSYIIGFAFLSSGLYFFYEEKKITGLVLLSLLPLVRHELSVITFGIGFVLFFTEKQQKFLKLIILFLPFFVYYILISWIKYDDPLFLFLGYRKLFFNGENVIKIIFSGKKIEPSIFLYYNPILYLFPLLFYSPRISSPYRRVFPFTLFLFLVPYLSKIFIPVMMLGLIGFAIFISRTGLRTTRLIVFLLLSQIFYIKVAGIKKEPYDLVTPYVEQNEVYQALTQEKFDYFLFPLDFYFVLFNDRKCILAKKILFSPAAVDLCNFGNRILLPNGKVISSSKFLKKHNKDVIISLTPLEHINNLSLFAKIDSEYIEIKKIIPDNQTIIVQCKEFK